MSNLAHKKPIRQGPVLDPLCPLTQADLDEIEAIRLSMRANGYEPLAIHSPWSLACHERARGKAPIGAGWQNGQADFRLFGQHPVWPRVSANTGLLLGFGGVLVQAFDFDIDDQGALDTALATARILLPSSALMRYRENSPRVALVGRCEVGALKVKVQGERGAIERLATGQQLVVHGTHPSGVELQWEDGRAPWTVDARDLPLVTEDQVAELLGAIAASGALGGKIDLTSAKGRPRGSSDGGGRTGPDEGVAAELRDTIASEGGVVVSGVRAFIAAVGLRGTYRHDSLVAVAGDLIRRGWPPGRARELILPEADAHFGEGSWKREVEAALSHAARRQAERIRADFDQIRIDK